jgi:hypothetical protein
MQNCINFVMLSMMLCVPLSPFGSHHVILDLVRLGRFDPLDIEIEEDELFFHT